MLSFDFELHWGVRDHVAANGSYRQNLLGARVAIPRLLELFKRYEIAATWATVGFLFAASRQELQQFRPLIRPRYDNGALNPYRESIGNGEKDDPFHYAASLVHQICQTPAQEMATHTFSHYYCLEPGQNRAAFRADLKSAVAIAAEHNVTLHSIVFPRNQVNPTYSAALLEAGITCYRGSESGWMYRPAPKAQNVAAKRAARLSDSYFGAPGNQIVKWSEIVETSGLCNVRGSRFLRPVNSRLGAFEKLRLKRIVSEMHAAAENHGIYHLWLHPHNLGTDMEANFEFVEQIFQAFVACRNRFGMRSLSMHSVAQTAREQQSSVLADANPRIIVPAHLNSAARVQA